MIGWYSLFAHNFQSNSIRTFRSWAYFERKNAMFLLYTKKFLMARERDCLSLSATSLLIRSEKRENHCQNGTITAINLQSIKNSIIEIPTHSSILNFGFLMDFHFVWELLDIKQTAQCMEYTWGVKQESHGEHNRE